MASGKDGGDLPRAKQKGPIKVLICDASSVVRRGLAQMLATDNEILVVAEASSVEHVVAVAEGAGAAIVIGDPHQLGAEAIRSLLGAGVKVLVVSFTVEERHLMQAIACGCSGYVDQREVRPEDLPRFVRIAADGHRVFSDGAFELLRRYLRQNEAVAKGLDLGVPLGRMLSSRERQVLGHLIRGRTNKTIAKLLGVSESTVKTFVTRIYEKLEVRNRLDLLSICIERGWCGRRRGVRGKKGDVACLLVSAGALLLFPLLHASSRRSGEPSQLASFASV